MLKSSGEPVQVAELTPIADDDDRRSATRFTLLIRTAKLVHGDSEYLCVIRDASQTGLKLRLFNDLPMHEPMVLELPNGEQFDVEQVWAREGHGGFRFPEPVELERLVDPDRGPYRSRKLRIRTLIEGRLTWGLQGCAVTFENLSQLGAAVVCEDLLAIDQLVKVNAKGLPPLYAKVRWRKRPNYGLIFEQTLSLEELARLVS